MGHLNFLCYSWKVGAFTSLLSLILWSWQLRHFNIFILFNILEKNYGIILAVPIYIFVSSAHTFIHLLFQTWTLLNMYCSVFSIFCKEGPHLYIFNCRLFNFAQVCNNLQSETHFCYFCCSSITRTLAEPASFLPSEKLVEELEKKRITEITLPVHDFPKNDKKRSHENVSKVMFPHKSKKRKTEKQKTAESLTSQMVKKCLHGSSLETSWRDIMATPLAEVMNEVSKFPDEEQRHFLEKLEEAQEIWSCGVCRDYTVRSAMVYCQTCFVGCHSSCLQTESSRRDNWECGKCLWICPKKSWKK